MNLPSLLSGNRISTRDRTRAAGGSLARRSPGVWPLVAGLVGTLLLLAGGNWLVDPYYLGSGLRLTGFNAVKPEAFDYSRVWKPHALASYGAETLILGTSSVEAGLDPESPAWKYHPVFNAAFGAAHPYEVMRLFQHAIAVAKPRQVVLGLDFTSFLTYSEKLPVRFNEARMAVDRNMKPTPLSARERPYQLLFTPSMLKSSLKTLEYQDELYFDAGDRYPRQMLLANGARAPSSNDRRLKAYGAEGMFNMSVESVNKRFADTPVDVGLARASPDNPLVGYTRQIFELAHANGVDLIVIMPPCHLSSIEAVVRSGHTDAFAKFKETIVDLNLEVAAKFNQPPSRLLDYCFPSHLTENRTTAEGAETKVTFFDSVHFSFDLGNRMIASWFDPAAGTIEPGDVRTYASGAEARGLTERDLGRLTIPALPTKPGPINPGLIN
jgi:hypothetical protein